MFIECVCSAYWLLVIKEGLFDMNEDELKKKLEWYEKNYGPYIEKRGFYSENFKNLFKKPRLNDWIVFVMLVLTLLTAFASYHDINTCHNTLNNLTAICYQLTSLSTDPNYLAFNLSSPKPATEIEKDIYSPLGRG